MPSGQFKLSMVARYSSSMCAKSVSPLEVEFVSEFEQPVNIRHKLNIAPRYIASIENSGQHPSLQILYELVTLLDVSVDQFFFPEREQEKSTRRRQLDTMLDGMSEKDLKILSATAKGIEEANNEITGE